MNELRREFEAHPDINGLLCDIEYIEKHNAYFSIDCDESCKSTARWASGAWWAYQEQHKKIIAYQKMLEMQKAFDEANGIIDSIGMRLGGYFEPMKYEAAGVVVEKELHYGEYLIDTSTLDKPQQNITIVLDGDKIEEIFMVNSNELHNNR